MFDRSNEDELFLLMEAYPIRAHPQSPLRRFDSLQPFHVANARCRIAPECYQNIHCCGAINGTYFRFGGFGEVDPLGHS